ncbi:MAG: DUF433 domain-containing protein [Planctomycetes bacterium]|nr:DUF433 domain-containing protein [Planctomycetota bacterium]
MRRTNPNGRRSHSSLLSRITVSPKVLVGKPVIRGTRISVEFVIDLLASGWTTGQILEEYDRLKPADIRACLAYAGEVLHGERETALTAPIPTEDWLQLRVLNLIARNPGIDAEDVARMLGVSDVAAIDAVAELRRAGIVGRAS